MRFVSAVTRRLGSSRSQHTG